MIHNNTFSEEWIQKISNDYKRGSKKADPTLIEKVTKALHLLENLSQTDLVFIVNFHIISDWFNHNKTAVKGKKSVKIMACQK